MVEKTRRRRERSTKRGKQVRGFGKSIKGYENPLVAVKVAALKFRRL